MAIQKAEAVVLRAENFREQSLLIDLYTREFGKIRGLVKGRRFIPSPCYTEIIFYPQRSGLHFISEYTLRKSFAGLNKSLLCLGAGNYFAELVNRLTFPEHKNEQLFHLLLFSLCFLVGLEEPREEQIKHLILIFEIKTLTSLGLFPSLEKEGELGMKENEFLPGTLSCLRYLKREGVQKGLLLKINGQMREQIEKFVGHLLSTHLPEKMRSREFLERCITR
ncbi:MAG: DNA repair protein RecO [Candidatus Omnitrophota bacterium]|nr:MAG: DNA repair protein RecO [Candidatus Omnitrophota bacterium]